ncbi:uncharacterized protein LOC115877380 [Sitophilus oryzae]|uniref:Uncharacterized protein LOC115877380 n=1 Tax=Sitophilus oryzae TaxID=7048 RepID=A0A6J2XE14_SITOR|nr:uncharacterized protein LOC115877380 [Sitophilus oryzae]
MKTWTLIGLISCTLLAFAIAENNDKESVISRAADDDSDMYMEPLEDHEGASSSYQPQDSSEQWFPSFARSYETYDHQPSGHSRPFVYNTYPQQEGAYSQRNDPAFQQNVRFNPEGKYATYNKGLKAKEEPATQASNDKLASLLGDGNFGVIQGGTFYAEKSNYDSENGFDDFSSYFRNGHGRPSYFYPSNPKAGQHAQFENFKDFADINTTPDRQYSQYVVVYMNKNGTRTSTLAKAENPTENNEQPPQEKINISKDVNSRPRNILERLAMLDNDSTQQKIIVPSYDQGDVIEIPPEKKISKSKRKLAKLLPEKKHKARLLQKEKDMGETLLALS